MTAKEVDQVIQELGRRIDEIAKGCGVAFDETQLGLTRQGRLTLKTSEVALAILAAGLQSEDTDQ